MILGPLKEDFTRENSPPQAKKYGFCISKRGFYKGKWHAAGDFFFDFGIPKRGFYKGKWFAAGEKIGIYSLFS